MKKLLQVFLILTLLTVTLALTATAATYGDLTYKVSNDEVTITDCNTSVTSVTIPSTIDGYPVTSIGSYAFSICTSLTSITIPSSVASIDDMAFGGCTSLTSITIPSSVTSIGSEAFYNCSNLTAVTFEEGSKCTSIGDRAFRGCTSLTSITIPSSVTSIGSEAFYWCDSLEEITLPFVGNTKDGTSNTHFGYIFGASSYSNHTPKSLKKVTITGGTSIASSAFYNCTNLTSITIPSSVTSIGSSAFSGCSSLTSITIPWGVTSIGSSAFSGCSSLTSITIPSSVTSIGSEAFYDCTSLTSITIPSSVTSIGSVAFCNCENLTSITIPSSVTSIGYEAFWHCTSLTSVTFEEGSKCTSIGSYAFYNCTSLTSITIPSSVTSIGSGAFYDCTSLTSITVSEDNASYSSLNGVLFNKDKTELVCYPCGKTATAYTIPSSVTSIRSYAFKNCENLTSVTFEEGSKCTSIGSSAFYYCRSLTSITIPTSVTSIGSVAFSWCTSLTSITFEEGSKCTSIGTSAFYNCTSLTSITIPSSVTTIGDGAFSWCTSLTSITIPSSVTSIGDEAFYHCDNLKSITIPSSVTNIGSNAFWKCTSLTSITVSEGNEVYSSLDGVLFNKDKTELVCYPCGKTATAYTIPSSVTSIRSYAFKNCENLTSVTFEEGSKCTSVGDRAFYDCTSLTSITIPSNVTSIGEDAFYGCSSLEEITLPFVGNTKDGTSNTHFGYIFGASSYFDHTTYVPKSLKKVTITGGTSIASSAFYNCSNLTSITIPSSVTSIGGWAFNDCTSLKEVHITDIAAWCKISFGGSSANPLYYAENLYLNGTLITDLVVPSSVTSIGSSAFYNCSNLTSIIIPSSVTSIGSYAFSYCTRLTSVVIPSSVTFIGSDAFQYCYKVTIYGYLGSYAETYANENDISFVPIDNIFTAVGNALLLDGTIGIKTYFEYDSTLIYPNTITVTATVKDADDGTNSVSTLPATLEDDGKTAYAVIYVSPKDYDNFTFDITVTADCIYADKESITVEDISVKGYIDTFKTLAETNEEYAKALDLVSSLDTYCKYADDYFNNEESLLGDLNITPDFSEISSSSKDGKIEGIDIYASSLVLKEATTIRHYFKVSDLNVLDTLTVESDGGNLVFDKNSIKNTNYLYIDITNIPAHKLGTSFTITLKNGDEEMKVTYSAMNYVKGICDNGEGKLLNLSKALYKYYYETLKYIDSQASITLDEDESEIIPW